MVTVIPKIRLDISLGFPIPQLCRAIELFNIEWASFEVSFMHQVLWDVRLLVMLPGRSLQICLPVHFSLRWMEWEFKINALYHLGCFSSVLLIDSLLLNGELSREAIDGTMLMLRRKTCHASTVLEMIYQTRVAWLTQTNLYALEYYSYIFLVAFFGGTKLRCLYFCFHFI